MQSKAKQKPKPLPPLVFKASDAAPVKGKAKHEPKPLLPKTHELSIIGASLDGGQTVEEALAACEALAPADYVAISTSAPARKKWHLMTVRELRAALAHKPGSAKLSDALDLGDYGVRKILDLARRPATSFKLAGRSLGIVGDSALFVTGPRQPVGGGLESISKSFGPSGGLESLGRGMLHVSSSIATRWRDELVSRGFHLQVPESLDDFSGPATAPPPDESPFEGEKPDTDALHWNTTFPDDAAVQQARTLFTGISYRLRTGLGAEPARGSLFDTRVSAAALSPSGEPVDVSFRIEARGAGVRKAGSKDAFGESVESGTLVCRKGAGTDGFDVEVKAEKPGSVTLTLDLNAKNAYVTSQVLELRALDANSPPLTAISMADLSRSRAVPIRLVVRRSNETYQLEAQVGAAGSIEPRAAALGTDDIETTILLGRDELVALSRGSYKPSGAGFAIEGGADVLKKMMDIGRRLHRALFGKDGDGSELRDMARLFALAGKRDSTAAPAPRLQIDAQLLPIPWGIVYDGQATAAPDPAGFWGMRFQIDRVVRVPISDRIERSATLEISPSTTLRPVIHPELDKQQSVTAVQEQQAFFAARGAAPPVTSRAGLEALLRSDDPIKLLYFFCHAAVPKLNVFKPVPSMVGTTLDIDGTPLPVSDMSEMRDAPLPGSPLVFLNACSSTLGDRASQSPFVVQFVKGWAARGVVGTEWEVPTSFADLFARRALRKLLVEGKTLGDSLHEVVIEAMKEGNPFGLIYAVYAPPEIIATHPQEPIHEP